MKKTVCALLILTMLLTSMFLMSCQNEQTNEDEPSDSATTETPDDDKASDSEDLPDEGANTDGGENADEDTGADNGEDSDEDATDADDTDSDENVGDSDENTDEGKVENPDESTDEDAPDEPQNLVLLDGEDEAAVAAAKAERNSELVKQGSYSVKTETTHEMLLVYKFDALDASAYKDGYLHMWIYVSDFENIKGGEIELTSAGIWDAEETSWKVVDYIKAEGWNELYLPLNAATAAAADLTRVNFLRVFTTYRTPLTATLVTFFDDICFTTQRKAANTEQVGDEDEDAPQQTDKGVLILLDDEDEATVVAAKLAQNSTYAKQGNYSIETVTPHEVRLAYKFDALNATAYKDGYLHMWIYVSNFENIKGGEIELTSAGIWDAEETSWKVVDYIKENGWNELYLPLNAATNTAADLSRVNFLRVFTTYHTPLTEQVTTYFDDICLVIEK